MAYAKPIGELVLEAIDTYILADRAQWRKEVQDALNRGDLLAADTAITRAQQRMRYISHVYTEALLGIA